MEHSMEAYLQRLPTERSEKFLQDYRKGELTEDFTNVIKEVMQELTRRIADSSGC